jgi:hypothetical protein
LIAPVLIGLMLGGLILIHMIRPRYLRRTLSSARFFYDLPQPSKASSHFKPGNPLRSRPIYLQFPILLMLLLMLLAFQHTRRGEQIQGIGLWIFVDTSASMSTLQEKGTRYQLAVKEIQNIITHLESSSEEFQFCGRLSSFDLERRDFVTAVSGYAAIIDALPLLSPRPLGTDLQLVRSVIQGLEKQEGSDCAITHVLVISDQSAPAWITDIGEITLLWRAVGEPVANVGISIISANQHPLTGFITDINMEVTAYGSFNGDARLTVTDPEGLEVLAKDINWVINNSWQGSFTPKSPGFYTIRVKPGMAYSFDDQAVIQIGEMKTVRIDWRLGDRSLPLELGWEITDKDPHIQVIHYGQPINDLPTIVLGSGYAGPSGNFQEIMDFYERSPLLTDINLDIVETLNISPAALLPGFQPVMRGNDGSVWLAERHNPPAAYIPGLPGGYDENQHNFSTTVFFNSVKWLLGNRALSPLYELTTPQFPNPEGIRLALHENEGNTGVEVTSFGDLAYLVPKNFHNHQMPTWPIWLSIILVFLLIERFLAGYGGEAWR